MSRLLSAWAVVLSICLLASGCGPREAEEEGIRVTVTVGMIADLVERVGGDRVVVTALMGSGVDPHLYKASARDLDRLRQADVIFYNGLHLEGKMVEVLDRIGRGGKKTVALGETVDSSLLLSPPEFQGQHDPHIWFDVSLWAGTIDVVVETLSDLDPENREFYESRGAEYRGELLGLHEEVGERLAGIPEGRRVLVTAHDAFGYFGRAYDIEVVGLQGISTTSEFGVSDRRRVVSLVVSRSIKAVFIESSVSGQAVNAVVDDCRQLGHEVSIGGELFSDAMGEAGTPEGTYVGMVRHNVRTIVKALK
jgi:manganese/zinc/iron transport system substrate-binding protein